MTDGASPVPRKPPVKPATAPAKPSVSKAEVGRRTSEARHWDAQAAADGVFDQLSTEQWKVLRERMQERHDEAMEDRRRFEDSAHRAAVFASGLATAAFGLSKLLGDEFSILGVLAIVAFGASSAVSFLCAGALELPAMHRLSTLVEDAKKSPERFVECEARDLMISSEEIRDAIEPVARWIRVSRCLAAAGVMFLMAQVIVTYFRSSEDPQNVAPAASLVGAPAE